MQKTLRTRSFVKPRSSDSKRGGWPRCKLWGSLKTPHYGTLTIPFLDPSPAAQNPSDVIDEEETPNMRELVRAIDSHMELVDLEVTSNLRVGDQPDENVQLQLPPSTQQTGDVIQQPSKDVALLQPADPLA